MTGLTEREIGVMFWAERDDLNEIRSLGVRCGQIGITGDLELNAAFGERWKRKITDSSFNLVTAIAAYRGESYADRPTVAETVGFVPEATRFEREQRTREVSNFAHSLGIGSIGCHAGMIPEDRASSGYLAVRDVVRRLCDYAAQHGQTFALETGQESPEALLQFLNDIDRPNLGVNFDPANMILYGTGEPIRALDVLRAHVLSVHCKDGEWPDKEDARALGKETVLGQGAVNIPSFVGKLKEIGFVGPLNIEREVDDPIERIHDIRTAIGLLKSLRG